MELCSDNHEEIVFQSRDCPMCNEIDEKDKLEEEIENLKKQLSD